MIRHRLIAGPLVWLACLIPSAAHADQDGLSKVRERYLAADYEGALALLDPLEARDQTPDLAVYKVFCLLALERVEEAKQAIKTIIEADPFFRLPEGQASPRMQAVFSDTRKELLPQIVQKMYANAKASFDKGDQAADAQFDRLLVLLDDPDLKNAQLSDLRASARARRQERRAGEDSAADCLEANTFGAVQRPAGQIPDPWPDREPRVHAEGPAATRAPAPSCGFAADATLVGPSNHGERD